MSNIFHSNPPVIQEDFRIFINGSGNVQFAAGAVLANHNTPNPTDRWGLTLGNTINGTNMKVSQEIFTHEYGHTLQGRRWGPLYFLDDCARKSYQLLERYRSEDKQTFIPLVRKTS